MSTIGFAAVDVVFSMVTDDQALQAVTSGADGILAGLKPGTVYVDMSTVSPRASRGVADQVRARGAEMLDAPVSGSIPQAESRTLAIMVGGDEQAFRQPWSESTQPLPVNGPSRSAGLGPHVPLRPEPGGPQRSMHCRKTSRSPRRSAPRTSFVLASGSGGS
jgi:hypothetical protein